MPLVPFILVDFLKIKAVHYISILFSSPPSSILFWAHRYVHTVVWRYGSPFTVASSFLSSSFIRNNISIQPARLDWYNLVFSVCWWWWWDCMFACMPVKWCPGRVSYVIFPAAVVLMYFTWFGSMWGSSSWPVHHHHWSLTLLFPKHIHPKWGKLRSFSVGQRLYRNLSLCGSALWVLWWWLGGRGTRACSFVKDI